MSQTSNYGDSGTIQDFSREVKKDIRNLINNDKNNQLVISLAQNAKKMKNSRAPAESFINSLRNNGYRALSDYMGVYDRRRGMKEVGENIQRFVDEQTSIDNSDIPDNGQIGPQDFGKDLN